MAMGEGTRITIPHLVSAIYIHSSLTSLWMSLFNWSQGLTQWIAQCFIALVLHHMHIVQHRQGLQQELRLG